MLVPYHHVVMDKNISIEQMLENQNNTNIYQSKSSYFPSLLMVASGIITGVLSRFSNNQTTGMLSAFLIALAIVLITWGVFTFLTRKSRFHLKENLQEVKITETFFEISERDKLVNAVQNIDLNRISELKPSRNETLKLRLASCADGSFGCFQVQVYVPYEYTNTTSVVQLNKQQTLDLKKKLNL